ncbi:hypothetical protein NC652_013478 [Populus alba x Populus x berolinensis]|nr:hypothetical protein NC652_013478 [Populus alba x Populus x berolinensis]
MRFGERKCWRWLFTGRLREEWEEDDGATTVFGLVKKGAIVFSLRKKESL